MIYHSNLECPDAYRSFKHMHSRVMGHSFTHDVQSDWSDKADDDPVFGIFKNCGSFTEDERAILAACAIQFHGKTAVDIGCNTGITAKTINWATNAPVECIDPMLSVPEFRQRFLDNTGFPIGGWCYGKTSDEYFRECPPGDPAIICIDGEHTSPQPLIDAQNSAKYLAADGIVVFHDAIGWPVRDGARWLMDNGFDARMYFTPHVLIVCWRGDFVPPDHIPDQHIVDQNLPARMPDFAEYFGRLK